MLILDMWKTTSKSSIVTDLGDDTGLRELYIIDALNKND